MEEKIIIFDTTLRDGEQSPGASLDMTEKLEVAQALARLGVDVIEAGFPVASPGDFEAIKLIAQKVRGPQICALARAVKHDIDTAWSSVKGSKNPRIHTFIATSDIHLKTKLKKSRPEVLELAAEAVRQAKRYTDNVEFSAEDAVRSDLDYLCSVVQAVIEAGATTVNIPDTVGYTIPYEFGDMIHQLRVRVPNIHQAVLSVHCHNDLGLAVANSLAAIKNGARQVECTINGIGERAGNAAMEEIVMALRTRKDLFGFTSGIKTEEIYKTSRLVSNLTGMVVQPNKAIVGANAFAHESGIHQDGFLKERLNYEIMTPESVGVPQSTLVLGKHSGRHALGKRLKDLGCHVKSDELDKVFSRFKKLSDKKKYIFDEDILALVSEAAETPETFALENFKTTSGAKETPDASVRLKVHGKSQEAKSSGDGPVDSIYGAIDKITGITPKLLDYSLRAVSRGKDAQGEATVRVEHKGITFTGRGTSTDIIEASAKAYVNALNKIVATHRSIKPQDSFLERV